jgi:hypothetical protein
VRRGDRSSCLHRGDAILHVPSVHSTTHTHAGSLWNRTATLWNSNWDKKALGFSRRS